jgi:hypothetical protein
MATMRRPASRFPLRWPLGEGGTVFWAALLLYIAVSVVLVFADNIIFRDALSRVASAQRILFSRDPHLAAIGFVWAPLPLLAVLPLVFLKGAWPALTQLGYAGNIVSALCMAGAVREFCLTLVQLRVRRPPRLALTALFAGHPLVILFAANGMSESMLLLCLLVATRHLLGWLRTGDLAPLVVAGIALAAGCLTRYETLAAAAAGSAVVGVIGYMRAKGSKDTRLSCAATDVLILAVPVGAAMGFWMLVSWLITGHPIEQFTSAYGNSSQLQMSGITATSMAARGQWIQVTVEQTIALEPFLLPVMLAGLLVATWRRALPPLGIVSTLGSVLLVMLVANAAGAITQELRYLIVEIPFAGLMAGVVLQPGVIRLPQMARPALPLATTILLAAAIPSSARALLDPRLDPVDGAQLRSIFSRVAVDEERAAARFVTERGIAEDLDHAHLASGAVLVDDFLGFPIVIASLNPHQFVITSDRDFVSALGDPPGIGVHYILVPQPTGLGRLDAVNRRYADLYGDGAGLGLLVREYANLGDGMTWRLYSVTPTS